MISRTGVDGVFFQEYYMGKLKRFSEKEQIIIAGDSSTRE